MILIDTSVWIDHLRSPDPRVQNLLFEEQVLIHAHVIGEIAVGTFRSRDAILAELTELPRTIVAEDDEVLAFITRNSLHGTGIGYIDAHLLAATRLTRAAKLWTRDKRLAFAAEALHLAYTPESPEHSR